MRGPGKHPRGQALPGAGHTRALGRDRLKGAHRKWTKYMSIFCDCRWEGAEGDEGGVCLCVQGGYRSGRVAREGWVSR